MTTDVVLMAAAAPAAHCLVPDSTVLGPEMTGSSLPTCLPADAPWTGRPAAHLLCPGSVVGSLCGAASSETWSRPPLCPLAIKVQTCGRSKWPVGRGRGEQGLHQGSRRDPSPAGRSFGEAGRSPARLFPAPPPTDPAAPSPDIEAQGSQALPELTGLKPGGESSSHAPDGWNPLTEAREPLASTIPPSLHLLLQRTADTSPDSQ